MSTKRRNPVDVPVAGRTSRRRTRKGPIAVAAVSKSKAKLKAMAAPERALAADTPLKPKSKSKGTSTKAKAPQRAATTQVPSPQVKGGKKIASAPQRAGYRARPKRHKASQLHDEKRPSSVSLARFAVGDVVRHKFYPFRGVIFDIDPVFANTEEWWLSIPENMRPRKNQPFYHLLAENAESEYIAYVSEQNLLPDETGVPLRHPQVAEYFTEDDEGRYRPVFMNQLN